jgi:hypothetical protein
MRNLRTSRFGCSALLIFMAAFSGAGLAAGAEEETTTTTTETTDQTEVESSTKKVGIGKFFKVPFHVSISVRGGYDDNVATQNSTQQGSAFASANIGINYNFGNTRTQVTLASAFGFTKYIDAPQDVNNDFNPNLTLTLTHKATPRLTLAFTGYATYQQQPDFTNNLAGLNRQGGSYFYTTDKFSLAYQWAPRFSTITTYTLTVLNYDNSGIGTFEDRTEHTFGNEFHFLLWPTTSLIAEYRYGIVAYDAAGPEQRDSTAQYFLGGVDHTFGPRFTVTARAGMEVRDYTNFGSRTDPYFEGTLLYALGPHLSLSWTNRYAIEEPDVPGSPSRTTFRTGLTARYNLTARIIAGLNAFWEHDNNDGAVTFLFVSPAFVEDVYSFGGSLRYAIDRNWGLELGYDFADVESEISLRQYSRNRFYGGLNLQF